MTPKRWVLDTSAAVPLLMDSHPAHQTVAAWAAGRTLGLSGHALLETYSVLTRLPGDARVTSADAVTLINGRFTASVTLSAAAASAAHEVLSESGVYGGASWDGLVALAAREHDVTLVTRDVRALATYNALGITTGILA